MKQVVQPTGGGRVQVLDVPIPTINPTQVLIQTEYSAISAGTERAMTSLAQASLASKAKARPDLVKQVLSKAQSDGVAQTVKAVRSRLAGDTPLGYSAVGRVVAVGSAVEGIRPGDRVATGGAGDANHAEFQAVPGLLCSRVPDSVDARSAAFTTIASIALHGLRLAGLSTGSKVVILGLGLLGQIAARLAIASGFDVAGIDLSDSELERAAQVGVKAIKEQNSSTTRAVLEWSRGRGADAVIVFAASKSSAPVMRSPELCRDGASIVVVGDVGLELDRAPFYERELSLKFARSYGPGRYERAYEEWGVDYPVGQVRWTENRNFEAILDLLASQRLTFDDLITHEFSVESATDAYEMIAKRSEPYLGVLLTYAPVSQDRKSRPARQTRATARAARLGIGWIGAGNFSIGTLIPAFTANGLDDFVAVSSSGGLSARRFADRFGFERTEDDPYAIVNDPSVGIVVIATPHSSHGDLVAAAVTAGKHIWVEKPLCLTFNELSLIEASLDPDASSLFVDFNRRFSPMVRHLTRTFDPSIPLGINYRVNAGDVDPKHWYADRREGGRLLGEVCHFIDTAATLTGSPITEITAVPGGRGEPLLAPSYAVSARHANGSVSNVSYFASGSPKAAKERVEILGQGKWAVLDDYRSLSVDGQRRRITPGKGHTQAVRAFSQAIHTGTPTHDWGISSMRATLAAAASLGVAVQ